MQTSPTYAQLLQIGADGERELITLEELKPQRFGVDRIPTQQEQALSEGATYAMPDMLFSGVPTPYLLERDSTFLELTSPSVGVGAGQEAVGSKRRLSLSNYTDLDEDSEDESKSVRTADDNRKQNHSEIEKRRRDKMNTYITELSAMIPTCGGASRKLDKLSVLRMAVQHVKAVQGAASSFAQGHDAQRLLSDEDLRETALENVEGFVFVVGCDQGRIVYVSDSVSETLNYAPMDLLGQSWFDILHPKDVAKVKDELTSAESAPRDRLVDAKTMLPLKSEAEPDDAGFCPGARRSFFCRMKYNSEFPVHVKEEPVGDVACQHRNRHNDWRYCTVQCTGFLKAWPASRLGLEDEAEGGAGVTCLVAVGRSLASLLPSAGRYEPTLEFATRHGADGKFVAVEQRATLVLGFLPQEMLGTSMFEYYHQDDAGHLATSHKAALQAAAGETVTTEVYRFRSKDERFVRLQSEWRAFTNPWTNEVDFVVARNKVVDSGTPFENEMSSSVAGQPEMCDFYMEGLLSRVDEHIGSISDHGPTVSNADERRSQKPADIGVLGNCEASTSAESCFLGAAPFDPVTPDNAVMEMMSGPSLAATGEGSDEAAMAVIMSLLEAEAGLGGPVDFSGLPWPLP